MRTTLSTVKKLTLLTLFVSVAHAAGITEASHDALFINANGYALGENDAMPFDCLLVHNGHIQFIGRYTDLNGYDQLPTPIDLKGATVLPGLIDAHGHVLELGQEQLQVDLRGSSSVEEALERVRSFASAHPELRWIRGRGWNQVLWPSKAFPSAADLDRVVTDRPVYMERIDGHAGWANSKALQLAHISAKTAEPSGGQIPHTTSGEPEGVLVDNAMNLITPVIPAPDASEMTTILNTALQMLADMGMTGVHDAGIPMKEFLSYEQLGAQNKLSIRVYAMLLLENNAQIDALKKGPRAHLYNDMLDLRAVKIIADGALGSRGAALLDDYNDKPGQRGLLIHDEKQLLKLMQQANHYKWQVNVHAIGDRANHLVLDNFTTILTHDGGYELRHRIEHAQVLTLTDIPRLATLNLIASMQPTHATSDMNMAQDRIGAQRLQGAYAWRKFLKSGARIAGGSDFPIELANPFLGLYAAISRQDLMGQPEQGWHGEEKMTRFEALRAFTRDAAYAAHMDERTGSLSPGQWADFIVIDRDYFAITDRAVADTKVLQTWVAGKRVH